MSQALLAFDARSAQYRGSGVASYASGLVGALAQVSERFDFVFLLDVSLPTAHLAFPPGARFLTTSVGRADWLRRDLWGEIVLSRRLRALKVDLFHGLDYTVPMRSTPFVKVATFHDAAVFTPLDGRSALAKARTRLMHRAIAVTADALVTDSDYSRGEIVRYLPAARDKITTTWVGIGDTFFRPAPVESMAGALAKARAPQGFVLYYGGFLKHKNVELLLRAYQRVAAQCALQLVLVGAGAERLGEMIATLGLRERVTFFGYASEDELKALLDQCALFVCPSALEGFGLPVAEAMARGAPVLCSTNGSLPEIAGDAVRYFPEATPEALARTILSTLADADLLTRLRAAGPLRAQRFRWAALMGPLADLYETLIRRKCARGS
jgi:glycosyltransferase involved in cell wall biosynthesis